MEYNEQDIRALALAFSRYIPVLAGTAGMKATRFMTGDVKSVSETDRTCVIESVLDNETVTYSDVNLSAEQNDGFIQVPAVDSTVIAAVMPDGEAYILAFSDIDKVICFIDGSNKFIFSSAGFVVNDGSLGGLIKITDLTNELNTRLNLIKTATLAGLTAIDTAIAALGAPANVGATAWNAAIASYSNLNKTAYEDNKFTH
jgi:hypothetical protein